MKIGASICRSTRIEGCTYIPLRNTSIENLIQAENQLNNLTIIKTLILFLPGNTFLRTHNFKDKFGNLHGHKARTRWKDKKVWHEMTKYTNLLKIARAKEAQKIVLVPFYVRNFDKVCQATFTKCKEKDLVERFSMAYAKKMIRISLSSLKKVVQEVGVECIAITLREFEKMCTNEQLNGKSKTELIHTILGDDDVHLRDAASRNLGRQLTNLIRK